MFNLIKNLKKRAEDLIPKIEEYDNIELKKKISNFQIKIRIEIYKIKEMVMIIRYSMK